MKSFIPLAHVFEAPRSFVPHDEFLRNDIIFNPSFYIFVFLFLNMCIGVHREWFVIENVGVGKWPCRKINDQMQWINPKKYTILLWLYRLLFYVEYTMFEALKLGSKKMIVCKFCVMLKSPYRTIRFQP